jgi:hypothetical protein
MAGCSLRLAAMLDLFARRRPTLPSFTKEFVPVPEGLPEVRWTWNRAMCCSSAGT